MLLALYLGLSVVLTSLHAYLVNYGEHKALRKERHERLMENDGEAPWAYRILSPAAAQGGLRGDRPLYRPKVGCP